MQGRYLQTYQEYLRQVVLARQFHHAALTGGVFSFPRVTAQMHGQADLKTE
jgi:hypothetical protein